MAPPRPSDRLRLAALVWVAAMRVGLWVLPLRTLRAAVSRLATGRTAPRRTRPTPRQIGDAVRAATRGVPRASCLVQALSAYALLTREGYPTDITLGGRFREDAFEAHAWVSCHGEIVTGGAVIGHQSLGHLLERRGPDRMPTPPSGGACDPTPHGTIAPPRGRA